LQNRKFLKISYEDNEAVVAKNLQNVLETVFKNRVQHRLLQFHFSEVPHALFEVAVARRTVVVVKNGGAESRVIHRVIIDFLLFACSANQNSFFVISVRNDAQRVPENIRGNRVRGRKSRCLILIKRHIYIYFYNKFSIF
jgi:hypothetical protein